MKTFSITVNYLVAIHDGLRTSTYLFDTLQKTRDFLERYSANYKWNLDSVTVYEIGRKFTAVDILNS